jgi:hypothetical protein
MQLSQPDCLRFGRAVNKDLNHAAQYYKLAAVQNLAHDQLSYANCLPWIVALRYQTRWGVIYRMKSPRIWGTLSVNSVSGIPTELDLLPNSYRVQSDRIQRRGVGPRTKLSRPPLFYRAMIRGRFALCFSLLDLDPFCFSRPVSWFLIYLHNSGQVQNRTLFHDSSLTCIIQVTWITWLHSPRLRFDICFETHAMETASGSALKCLQSSV